MSCVHWHNSKYVTLDLNERDLQDGVWQIMCCFLKKIFGLVSHFAISTFKFSFWPQIIKDFSLCPLNTKYMKTNIEMCVWTKEILLWFAVRHNENHLKVSTEQMKEKKPFSVDIYISQSKFTLNDSNFRDAPIHLLNILHLYKPFLDYTTKQEVQVTKQSFFCYPQMVPVYFHKLVWFQQSNFKPINQWFPNILEIYNYSWLFTDKTKYNIGKWGGGINP